MDQRSLEKNQLQAIRGMKDILPVEARYYQHVERLAREAFELYGYQETRMPILEPTELFARSAGEASDIVVSKQMYTFIDPGNRSNTMRPEGTAGVVRALIEHGVLKETSQQKLYYIGPMFRYEKPQKGRLRQFTQIGLEFFGIAHPAADAEVIAMCDDLLRRIGFAEVKTKINNIGCRECRREYNDRLRQAIAGLDGWCEQCRRRYEVNPMRVFDCKVEGCRELLKKLPRVSDFVCEKCREHFDVVVKLLDASGVPYEVDPELVRGLDYYSRTVFEIVHAGLGAQNTMIGGGRYDYLVEDLGGPATPAVGMSIGVERLILAMESSKIHPPVPTVSGYYVLALDEHSVAAAARLTQTARQAGVSVAFDCQPRSARAGLKAANRSGARVAIIVGADELSRNSAQWKNLETGEQIELPLAEIERNIATA